MKTPRRDEFVRYLAKQLGCSPDIASELADAYERSDTEIPAYHSQVVEQILDEFERGDMDAAARSAATVLSSLSLALEDTTNQYARYSVRGKLWVIETYEVEELRDLLSAGLLAALAGTSIADPIGASLGLGALAAGLQRILRLSRRVAQVPEECYPVLMVLGAEPMTIDEIHEKILALGVKGYDPRVIEWLLSDLNALQRRQGDDLEVTRKHPNGRWSTTV